jgi:predicted TIM-barrel fold metal-dependent hydrolase
VILLGASFSEAWHGIEHLIAPLSEDERAAILGGTASRIFGLG